MTHRVTYGAGAQTIRGLPVREGRAVVVASATAAIVDLRYSAESAAHVLQDGPAVVDSVATTTTAPAGRGTADPQALELTSTAGVVAGRRYLLSYGGHSDAVRVEEVAGLVVTLESILPRYYAAGAAFVGLEVAVEVPADVTGEKLYLVDAQLAVRWSFAGLPPVREAIYLERAAPTPAVSPDAVLALDATLSTYLASGATIAGHLAVAQAEFQVDLLAAGHDDASHLAGPIGRDAVRSLAAWHCLKHSSDASAVARAKQYRARYDELRAALIVGLQKEKVLKLDADGSSRAPVVVSPFLASW